MNKTANVVSQTRNVFGKPMQICCLEPATGYYRDGFCHFGEDDFGVHGVCVVMNAEFLAFSKEHGNDLSTSIPEYGFVGLKPGDAWCLCADRWIQAYNHGMAPKLKLESCHNILLELVPLEVLQQFAAD